MDGDLIQQKIYGGLAKAANRLGRAHSIYRPSGTGNPLDPARLIGTTLATFSSPGAWYPFSTGTRAGQSLFHVLVDGNAVNVGDYLTRASDIFFVAQKQHIAPILAYQCNRTVKVLRPALPSALGLNTYAGDFEPTETVLLTDWPAAVNMMGGGHAEVSLPADAGVSSYQIMLPFTPTVEIRPSDILRDEKFHRYIVKGCEPSATGWKLSTVMAVT